MLELIYLVEFCPGEYCLRAIFSGGIMSDGNIIRTPDRCIFGMSRSGPSLSKSLQERTTQLTPTNNSLP